MTIAHDIAVIGNGSIAAMTLAGGYAVHYDGSRTLFPAGRVTAEKRNAEERCTLLDAEYADGSKLRFTWHPQRGARYIAR